MAPSTSLSSHERTRVEDYLNDKIQVTPDLESLDSLLSNLRAQQDLQRKQVSLALPRVPQTSTSCYCCRIIQANASFFS